MIKDIHFASRYQAERVEGRLDVIVVSIHDRHAQPNLRSGFRDVLYLAFDDYDRERDGADALMEPFSRRSRPIRSSTGWKPTCAPTPPIRC